MISVLITNYLQPELTKLCIESVEETDYKDIEILVWDNSVDNVGLAIARNRMAKKAKGEYIFFLDNDTIVKKDIFNELSKEKHDIVGCREFDYYGKNETNSMPSLDRFGCPAGDDKKLFYPNGAIYIKRSVFEEIGGYDDKMFYYGEDRDLCWRALVAGYTVGYCKKAVFFHRSNSVGATNYQRRYLSERNIIRTMLKNYTLKSLVKILPQYLFWSILECSLVLLTQPAAIARCYLPAYWWNIKNLRDTISLRKTVIHRIPDSELPFSKRIGKLWVLLNSGVPKWEGEMKKPEKKKPWNMSFDANKFKAQGYNEALTDMEAYYKATELSKGEIGVAILKWAVNQEAVDKFGEITLRTDSPNDLDGVVQALIDAQKKKREGGKE